MSAAEGPLPASTATTTPVSALDTAHLRRVPAALAVPQGAMGASAPRPQPPIGVERQAMAVPCGNRRDVGGANGPRQRLTPSHVLRRVAPTDLSCSLSTQPANRTQQATAMRRE